MLPTIYIKQTDPREKWHAAYIHELVDLYDIFMTRFTSAYPDVAIDDRIIFHHFSRLVFHSSSGFISDYTKANSKST